MRRATILLLCGFAGLMMLGCAEQGAGVVTAQNHPPQLVSLTADRTLIGLGETATITAVAVDPDGDPLTYSWVVTAGQVQGTGSQVTFVAPNEWGAQFIRVQVEDGRGGVAFATVSVTAQEDAAPRITSLAVQPSVLRSTGGTATITAHIVDRSGTAVASATATVSLRGNTLAQLDLVRVSGDAREGDYQTAYQAAANLTDPPQDQTYQVTAAAQDMAGHNSETASTSFTVEAISSPPNPPT